MLNTWWFCSPDWPPAEHNYQESLQEMDWRKVSLSDWRNEPNLDSDGIPSYIFYKMSIGNEKAFEIPLHPQIFQSLLVFE